MSAGTIGHRTFTFRGRLALAAVVAGIVAPAATSSAALVGQYQFNGDLTNTVTGGGAAPAATGVNFNGNEFATAGLLALENARSEYATVADTGWVPNAGQAITIYSRFRSNAIDNNFQLITGQWITGGMNFHFNVRNASGTASLGEVELYLNGALAATVADAIAANQAYDAAFTLSAGGVLRMYLNGVQQGTDITGKTLANSADAVGIGSKGSPTASTFFNGSIDEVRFYNNDLTPAEVAAIPEPAAVGLLGVSAMLLAARRRSRSA